MVELKDCKLNPAYYCWLNYRQYKNYVHPTMKKYCQYISASGNSKILNTAVAELKRAFTGIFGDEPQILPQESKQPCVCLQIKENNGTGSCGFSIKRSDEDKIIIAGTDENGLLYGVFRFIFFLGTGQAADKINIEDKTYNKLRIVEQWDNVSGDIERGYSGNSIFYQDGKINKNTDRIRDYARLLCSVGINSISLNNVNVFEREKRFITDDCLPDIARIASVFSDYGIRVFLSINFAAPIALGELDTADPLEPTVRRWWAKTADKIYSYIPDFGGFLIKADSENSAGPFTYGRDHAQGANMLAEALEPHGGIVIWRCFVYNCHTDWRDRKTDRARAAYDNFLPLDGKFNDNVVLQIKNGPMDFQIREPVTPLFGGLEKTNQVIEFQIAQEYTGHQIDLCYLVPMWKEALNFDTFAKGKDSPVRKIVNGRLFGNQCGGIAGVSNIGDSPAWTGNPLAQANLFGFGRLSWHPCLSSEEIADEWARLTFGVKASVTAKVTDMLLKSRDIYEKYTCPLGIGWFVNPQAHYGPSVDGYEYSHWGTYHYADIKGIGVDRTVATGTGYAGQYRKENAEMYENVSTCPENLLLFFHHLPYSYVLKSGQTILQYIYDTHFEGAEEAKTLLSAWKTLADEIDESIFAEVLHRFEMQIENAVEWRDVVNTYFYRKTGISDKNGRYIYP